MNQLIKITLLFCFLFTKVCFSQNLVPNPSFEDTVQCPTSSSQIGYATGWINPTLATPDYFNSCATGNFGVPINALGERTPRTGNAYAGILSIVGNGSGWREYIQIQLMQSLISGVKYCVGFYVSIGDSSTYSINNIGAYLSVNPISIANNTEIPVTPQIVNNALTSPIIQPNIWQLVTDSIYAVGGENYLTIGNFNNDSLTDTNILGGSLWAEGYQFIDDVFVEPCSTISISKQSLLSHVTLYPNPSNGYVFLSSNMIVDNYSVFSSLGQEILNMSTNSKYLLINLINYPSGIYFISIKINDLIIMKKIIIN